MRKRLTRLGTKASLPRHTPHKNLQFRPSAAATPSVGASEDRTARPHHHGMSGRRKKRKVKTNKTKQKKNPKSKQKNKMQGTVPKPEVKP